MAKDVLVVLSELTAGSNVQRIRAAEEAIDKLSELIAADVEYDLAVAAVLSCTNKPAYFTVTLIDYIDSSRNRLEAAKERRAAALAACRGL